MRGDRVSERVKFTGEQRERREKPDEVHAQPDAHPGEHRVGVHDARHPVGCGQKRVVQRVAGALVPP
jgi:hypothetical protein